MTATPTTSVNGAPVGVGTAAAFAALSADFKAATGCELRVNGPLGGIRTFAEQERLYQAYLHGGTLAANPEDPSAAHHMTAHALDISDTGADAGVDTIGSPRHNTLVSLLPKHNFTNEGDHFTPAEAWHIYYQGDPFRVPGTLTSSTTSQGDDDMSAAEVQQISVDIQRGTRARLFLNTETNTYFAINWNLPSTDKAKILFANGGAGQVARWHEFEIVGDQPANAVKVTTAEQNELIGLARGTDSAYTEIT